MGALTLSAGVHHLVITGGMAPEKFLALVRLFGPLPEDGIQQLAQRMVAIAGIYRLQQLQRLSGCKTSPNARSRTRRSRGNEKAPTKVSEQLKSIANHARRLLASMGIDDPEAVSIDPASVPMQLNPPAQLWLFVELYKVANERRPTTATLAANERMTFLVTLLSDLVAAADRCAASARQQSIRGSGGGRGGKGREGTTPESTLLYALFETYTTLRRQFPTRAPPQSHRRRRGLRTGDPMPVLDAPFKAFVRAGLALAVTLPPAIVAADGKTYSSAEKIYGRRDLAKRTTDSAIRGAFYRWRKSQSTVRTPIDLRITPIDKT